MKSSPVRAAQWQLRSNPDALDTFNVLTSRGLSEHDATNVIALALYSCGTEAAVGMKYRWPDVLCALRAGIKLEELFDKLTVIWVNLEIERGAETHEAFDALLARGYTKREKSTRDVYDVCLDRIAAAWGNLPVRDLLPKHIYKLMEVGADRPSMANMVVSVLRVLLREGIKRDYCTINVARDIEMLEEAGIGAEPWPENVYAFVLEHAPPLLMRAAVLGRATGQRGCDLVEIRPADRKENGFNALIKKLGNERHWVPITSEAWKAVDGWHEEKMIFYLNVGGRHITEGRLRDQWAAFRKLHPHDVPSDATLHDLRAISIR